MANAKTSPKYYSDFMSTTPTANSAGLGMTQLQAQANALVDEQALLDKFNAATTAQYNLQREQNRQAENTFYNQMYNTQQTAMDTIRQSNAAAVSTGASRGIQAANELSAILGLQQESVASATELANANRQTAQEETAAVLENVLNAYQQAEQQRQNLITSAIQGASVDNEYANTLWNAYLQAQANGDSAGAAAAWNKLQGVINGTTTNTSTQTPVLKSDIQEDGSLVFTTADLNDKNTRNIYNVLNKAGYYTDNEQIINLNDSADYDLIKQVDFSSSKQKGKAAEYIRAIQNDIADNKIPVGSIMQLNYGASGDNHIAVYLGNGRFARLNISELNSDLVEKKVYVPKGYKHNLGHNYNPNYQGRGAHYDLDVKKA